MDVITVLDSGFRRNDVVRGHAALLPPQAPE